MEKISTQTYRSFGLILFLYTSIFPELQAQETHTFNFTAFSLKPGDYTSLYFFNSEGKSEKIEFKAKRRSAPHSAKVDLTTYTLPFYAEIPSDPEIPLPPPVGSVQINSDWKEVLLVFRDKAGRKKKSEQSIKSTFTIVAADDSSTSFKGGSIKLLNLTGVPIIGTVNKEKFAFIDLAASKAFDVTGTGSATIILATKGKNRYRMIYKNEIDVSKRNRAFLILRAPHRTGSIKIGGQLLLD